MSGRNLTRYDMAYDTYGEKRIAYQILVGKPEGMRQLEDLCIEGRVIITYNLKKSVGKARTRLCWQMTGISGGLF
jgi:hypothetical protein